MSLSTERAGSNSRAELPGETLAALLCAGIGTLAADIIAGALAIAAGKDQQRLVMHGFGDCKSVAGKIALRADGGIFLLVIAHALTIVYGIYAWRREVLKWLMRIYVMLIAVLSIFSGALGFYWIVMGQNVKAAPNGSCAIVHPGYLFWGGILCFIHGAFAFFGFFPTFEVVWRYMQQR